MMDERLETLAAELEASDHYKVLRRLQPRLSLSRNDISLTRCGLMLDLETTGLDPSTDEIIEIALVPFLFTAEGRVVDIPPAFVSLREPSRPISEMITKLTGITNEMVAGHVIDSGELEAVVAPADLILAHNARFDRPFAEKLHPVFVGKPWACSMTQAPWAEHGFEGLKLSYLLTSSGLYHDGHRALDDCHAAIELLARPLGATGRTALSHVLETSARATVRIWAVGAPYDKKDWLRSRHYRWNAGDDGQPRAWSLEVDETGVEAEIAALRTMIFGSAWQPVMSRIMALERFSDRSRATS